MNERDDFPEVSTRSIGSAAVAPRVTPGDYFARVTIDAAAAVSTGEITTTDLGVYTALCSEAWRTGVVETLIADLARRLRWGVTESDLRNLRNALGRLKRAGLVAYETTRRQRAAWRIEIPWVVAHPSPAGSKLREDRDPANRLDNRDRGDFRGARFQDVSKSEPAVSKTEGAAIPVGERPPDTSEPNSLPSPTALEREKRVKRRKTLLPLQKGDDVIEPTPATDEALLAFLTDLAPPLRDAARTEWTTLGGPEKVRYCVSASDGVDAFDAETFTRLITDEREAFLVHVQRDLESAVLPCSTYRVAEIERDRAIADGTAAWIEGVKGAAAETMLKALEADEVAF
jgi:hypothetical protein